jgi:hypothetical protein
MERVRRAVRLCGVRVVVPFISRDMSIIRSAHGTKNFSDSSPPLLPCLRSSPLSLVYTALSPTLPSIP